MKGIQDKWKIIACFSDPNESIKIFRAPLNNQQPPE